MNYRNKNIRKMIKKTFEKEPYVAPQWNLRVITVERHLLSESEDNADYGYEDNPMGEI